MWMGSRLYSQQLAVHTVYTMKFITKHVAYSKDNPEGYWFKRKLYGVGWVPAKTAGWVTLGIYVGFVLGIVLLMPPQASDKEAVAHIIGPVIGATILLLVVTWKTGEPLKWQWGETRDEE